MKNHKAHKGMTLEEHQAQTEKNLKAHDKRVAAANKGEEPKEEKEEKKD